MKMSPLCEHYASYLPEYYASGGLYLAQARWTPVIAAEEAHLRTLYAEGMYLLLGKRVDADALGVDMDESVPVDYPPLRIYRLDRLVRTIDCSGYYSCPPVRRCIDVFLSACAFNDTAIAGAFNLAEHEVHIPGINK